MTRLTRSQLRTVIGLALVLGTFILYWPVTHNGFTNFDDDGYITGNPHVNSGLSWSNIRWAFEHIHAGYWIPLTWISHMLDCQFFGLNAGGHHLMSVLFHIANTLLLFWWLTELTGATWRSAFVAALFAWHPLHVESVAWACERKDVLSAFFWMLALIAYTRYAEKSTVHSPQSRVYYGLSLFLFACGLMSKPMVVTLPFVLLLLDFWPFGRFAVPGSASSIQNGARLVLEKIPFFILAAAGSAIVFFSQKVGGAVSADTFSSRLANVLWAYVRYLSKNFWPVDLAVVYPFQNQWVVALAVVAALLLAVCSGAFILMARRRPYLFTGWFWFLGTLVPAIGIVQVGSQSMADRFTYVPGIGLFILVAWSVNDLLASTSHKRKIAALLGAAALAGCLALTSIQITYWRSSITLFRHALAVTRDNYVAGACLGQALNEAGQTDEALVVCREAVRLNPDYPPGQFFLGTVLWKIGEPAEAFGHLLAAAESAPRNPIIQNHFGKFLLDRNLPDQAARRLAQAVALEPDNADYRYDYGTVLLGNSNPDEAIAQFSEALRLKPDSAGAHKNLAVAFTRRGKMAEAIAHFSKVAEAQPASPEAHFNLGLALLNTHQPAAAAIQFAEELRLKPETKAHYRLAQALQQQDRPAEAVRHYREALRLTPDFPEAKKELDEILAAHPELR
jgi:protein O-mannosyl-transferase